MKFHDFFEGALGSKVKVKVLRYLLSEGVPTSEHEIARILGVSHTAVNKSMKEFCDFNIVTPMRIGNANAWKVNERHYAYNNLKLLKDLEPPLENLKSKIKGYLGQIAERAVIFGSVAEGKELPDSDVDLLVLVKNDEDKKRALRAVSLLAEACLTLYGNKLSPYVLTYGEYAKDNSISKAAEKGIVVI